MYGKLMLPLVAWYLPLPTPSNKLAVTTQKLTFKTMLYEKRGSGEEVSVSLGYALGLRTDQTPSIRASKKNITGKNKT